MRCRSVERGLHHDGRGISGGGFLQPRRGAPPEEREEELRHIALLGLLFWTSNHPEMKVVPAGLLEEGAAC